MSGDLFAIPVRQGCRADCNAHLRSPLIIGPDCGRDLSNVYERDCTLAGCHRGPDVTGLSEVLTAANTGGLSARAVARRAQEHGHSLNHDTAARYLRGDHGRPDESTLLALADVLDVPLATLRAAAGLPSEETDPYVPPLEANRLSRRQRRAVDEIIRAMLDPGAGRGTRDQPTDLAARRRAARHGPPEPPVD